MKVLIAPDKLKGSLSATDAADCIAAGVRLAAPDAEIDLCPIADGGEGTVAALARAFGGKIIKRRVTGPLPEMKVDAAFALLDDRTAVIEMSAASGLALLKSDDRNPLNTTTFGTGELITAAVREGAKKIILGLGGSATIDAGLGMLQACGFTILTKDGQPTSLSEPLCGRDLSNILMVKHGRGEITSGIPVLGLADVTNPLCGPTGAAAVFGPQKGATPEMIHHFDHQLQGLVQSCEDSSHATKAGSGAAGGVGFAILTCMHGAISSGFEYISTAADLRSRVKGVDLCFTAEGRLDSQTLNGKAVVGIARLCREMNIPCIVLAGSLAEELEWIHEQGITAAFAICDGPMSLAEAMQRAGSLLTSKASDVMRMWLAKAVTAG